VRKKAPLFMTFVWSPQLDRFKVRVNFLITKKRFFFIIATASMACVERTMERKMAREKSKVWSIQCVSLFEAKSLW
jgi:hypothetical protein